MKKGIFTAAMAVCILLTGCSNSGEQTSGGADSSSVVSENTTANSQEGTTASEGTTSSSETTAQQDIDMPTAEAPASTEPALTAEAGTYEPQFEETTVHADYAGDMTGKEHDEYFADIDDGVTMVLFTTDKPVTNFRILALTSFDIDADGNTTFSNEAVYEQPELSPEKPLLAGLVFLGDIPNNGISYVDENGVERRYAVDMSGRDGSIFLWSF